MIDVGTFLARASSDSQDRLIEADEPLAGLQRRCGGELPGVIAVPALLELVRKCRLFRLNSSQAIQAQDGENQIDAWVEVTPRQGESSGCDIVATSWKSQPMKLENLVEYADDIPFNAQLATIVTDLEIGQDWRDLKINTDPCAHIDELRALYSELEFRNELASLDHPNHPANANGNGAQSVADSQADAESQAQIAKSLQSSINDNIKDSKTHDKAWHTVLDEPAFDSLVTLLESAPHFVIDTETTSVYWRQAELVGLSFAVTAHEAYYVPLTHSLEGDELTTKQLDRNMVLTRLKPILENPNIGKIGQHLKYDAHILSFYDVHGNSVECR